MKLRHAALAAVLALGAADVAAAQSSRGVASPGGDAVGTTGSRVDVSRLPIDVSRIERKFKQSTFREERDGLNLRYFLNVYAPAPPIVLFTKADNLQYGPVPYGAPTHREMIDNMTPREYRAPAADLSGLFRWLAGEGKSKSK